MIGEDQAIAALLRLDFRLFLRFAFREIGGEGDYLHNWHIDAIIYQLDRVRSGDVRRLIVSVPPRHLKSFILTTWVAWLLGNNPALRFIVVSYSYELAEKLARDCLRIIESTWFRAAFPNFRLTKRSVLDFETSAGGGRLSTSVHGVLTGRGADIIAVDDPLKADDALSELARESNVTWMFNTLMSRLNDQRTGAIVMVMQRLHEADLAGEALHRGGWEEVRLSAIAVADERIQVGSDRFYQRRQGCALHPSRQPLEVLERIRAEDSRVFAAQYQQEPVPEQGNFVDPKWFCYYDGDPPASGIVVQSWDTASKNRASSDFSAGITAIYHQKRFYALDVCRARMTFPELRAKVAELCRRYKVQRLLIEDMASGTQLIQMLREPGQPHYIPRPIACKPEGDKDSRFAAQASRIQAGELVLPRTAPWLADFITEIIGFPNARYDDQADALAQLLRHGRPIREPLGLCGPRVRSIFDD
jgi:predicted phage terminase large subunit-like protein